MAACPFTSHAPDRPGTWKSGAARRGINAKSAGANSIRLHARRWQLRLVIIRLDLQLPHRVKAIHLFALILAGSFFVAVPETLGAGAPPGGAPVVPFPRGLETYQDEQIPSIWGKLQHRMGAEPFNVVSTLIFFGAIVHTFAAAKLMNLAHRFQHEHDHELDEREKRGELVFVDGRRPVSFKATAFHFLGEIEAIFGIWLVPLIFAISIWFGWDRALNYIDSVNYTEAIFVVIIMTISATRPVVKFASNAVGLVAQLGRSSPAAWWFTIMSVLPLLGSFITEPAAMTIAALLLSVKFYHLQPSERFKYATLGALFVNVSVGGTLTQFAAPPVLMVASRWELTIPTMLVHFGWKAAVGILITNTLYYLVFRREFVEMAKEVKVSPAHHQPGAIDPGVPGWVTGVHLIFLAWTVVTLHHPALVIFGFLFFLAFKLATMHHQDELNIRGPLLVGFFLAALVSHGGLQGWWIQPILSGLGELPLFLGSMGLTALNDNAAITYLASLVPALDHQVAADPAYARALQYAVLTGAVTGGGLTVIANAPNPAGQSILSQFFKHGVSPVGLFLGALAPTIILALCFTLLRTF